MTRTWPALCAWGAGLVHLASGAGSLPHPLGFVLVLLGSVEFLWGVAALRSSRAAPPAGVIGGALGAIALSAVAALTGAMAWLPLVAASVQLLIIAAIGATELRRRSSGDSPQEPRAQRTGRTIASFALCAALVSGLTTPALAATDAGDFAVPHGSHGSHG
jgi:hypothetical protein